MYCCLSIMLIEIYQCLLMFIVKFINILSNFSFLTISHFCTYQIRSFFLLLVLPLEVLQLTFWRQRLECRCSGLKHWLKGHLGFSWILWDFLSTFIWFLALLFLLIVWIYLQYMYGWCDSLVAYIIGYSFILFILWLFAIVVNARFAWVANKFDCVCDD